MRRLAALCGIIGAAAIAAALLPAASARALEVKRVKLDNGMIVLISPQHNLPMVTASIGFDAGARRDPKGKEGLASLSAASLMEGTRAMSADELNRKVDFLGSAMDVGAGSDYATASFTSLKRYWRDTLKLLAGVLTDPGLRPEDISRKQAEQVAGLKAAEEQPGYVAQITFLKEVFGEGSPYGHLPDGTVDTVQKLSAQDVRDFYRQFYRPESAVAAVVGDVDADEVVKALNESLAPLTGTVAAQKPSPLPPIGSGVHLTAINRDVAQANIIMGFDGIARSNPDYYKLQVMNYILGGGGFASRLVKEVRSKAGLAYSVASYFQAALFPGSFQVVLETKNKTANEAIAMVLQQMKRIQESPVADAEMDSAKKFLIGSFPLKLDTQNSIVSFLMQVQIYGLGLDYIERYPGYIRSVTKEDVQKVARQYLHPDSYILVAVANQSEAGIKVASSAASGKQ
ncbi:MAG TPA: pitrilysin family protein [Candidatus Binataceae bacterium]|nr:pitrilysin family protein [Candidatus Binataceae bacterium]